MKDWRRGVEIPCLPSLVSSKTTVRLSQKVLHPLLKISFITCHRDSYQKDCQCNLQISAKKLFKHSWMVAAHKQLKCQWLMVKISQQSARHPTQSHRNHSAHRKSICQIFKTPGPQVSNRKRGFLNSFTRFGCTNSSMP